MKRIILILSIILSIFSTFILAQPKTASREIVHPDLSQNRTALVIGNGDYKSVSRLNNAVKDSHDVADTLQQLGFEVIKGENLSAEKMKRVILEFGEKLTAKKGVGVFYYAGHGVQLNGRNYLIPIEADSLREQTIEFDAVDVNRVLAEMDAAQNGLNLVILDACRNNPFTRSWRGGGTEGLANINAPSGTLIAFATAPGEVASDGKSNNGLYTSALLKWMREPDLKVEDMFKKVRVEVAQQSQNKQIPWESSSLQGDFYFNPKILKQAIANAQKKTNQQTSPSENIKVSVNPIVGARPKYKGKLLTYSFETPYLEDENADLKTEKKEANYFVERLGEEVDLEMMEIRGGTFTMGSTLNEVRKAWQTAKEEQEIRFRKSEVKPETPLLEEFSAELPAHNVSIKPFFMSKYEVTQRQWKAVMGDLPKSLGKDGFWDFKNDDFPIVGITWLEAKEFCQKLSQKTGKKYRLPSEAEWEYAARAGSQTSFAFGNAIDQSLVNYGYPFNILKVDLRVEKYYPNAFGLFQMHGNVDEMVEDEWFPNYQNAPTDGTPRKDSAERGWKVIRGGNFINFSSECRSASRSKISETERNAVVGFRIVGEIQ